LKTGFLISAFKDSEDMEGMKKETLDYELASRYVAAFLRLGYETVLVEKRN
jgi:hypothetical protein